MLIWKIRSRDREAEQLGWIVAFSYAEACDVARRENAELIADPIEWMPGKSSQVFWLTSEPDGYVH